jgi:hypothetical protein
MVDRQPICIEIGTATDQVPEALLPLSNIVLKPGLD